MIFALLICSQVSDWVLPALARLAICSRAFFYNFGIFSAVSRSDRNGLRPRGAVRIATSSRGCGTPRNDQLLLFFLQSQYTVDFSQIFVYVNAWFAYALLIRCEGGVPTTVSLFDNFINQGK